jgi:hypothetical protein
VNIIGITAAVSNHCLRLLVICLIANCLNRRFTAGLVCTCLPVRQSQLGLPDAVQKLLRPTDGANRYSGALTPSI